MRKLILAVSVLMFLSGCIINPLMGGLYTDVSFHTGDHQQEKGAKSEKSCVTNILGLVATGDASVKGAMERGGITKVRSIDYQMTNTLGIYATFCVIVTGE